MDKNSENLSTYLGLFAEFYALSKPYPPSEKISSRVRGACSGTHVRVWAFSDSFDVHGFDASPTMLERLHKKA